MEFKQLPGIVTKTGLTYEVAQDGTVRSVTKGGVTKILKPQGKRVSISGKPRNVCDLVEDAGWLLTVVEQPLLKNDDIQEEIFENIRQGYQYNLYASNRGRLKYEFRDAGVIIKTAEVIFTEHTKRRSDTYPHVMTNGKHVNVHDIIVELFIGKVPLHVVVDHRDDVKVNARLGNLQLLTPMEIRYKRHLKNHPMSVASFVEKKYEKTHNSKKFAIEHVINNGYSNASLEELETSLQRMADEDTPCVLYGRTWIPAHFENNFIG
jgi:hypothetical protein